MKFHTTAGLLLVALAVATNPATADSSIVGVALNPYTTALTLNRLAQSKGNSEDPDNFISLELNFPFNDHRYEVAIPLLYRENKDLVSHSEEIWVANSNRVVSADIAFRRHFEIKPYRNLYVGPFLRYTRVHATTESAIRTEGSGAKGDDLSRMGLGLTFGYKHYFEKAGFKGGYWGINLYLGAYTDDVQESDGYIDNFMWSSFDSHTRAWIRDLEFFKFGYEF